MTESSSQFISTVAIGYMRSTGTKLIAPIFESTPYVLTAFLDCIESSESHRYTPHNLGVVLASLHPRPKALVIGPAIDPAKVDEMKAVWDSYVENVLKSETTEDEWKRSAFVGLPKVIFINPLTDPGPPKDDAWKIEMFRQLDSVFRPEVVEE